MMDHRTRPYSACMINRRCRRSVPVITSALLAAAFGASVLAHDAHATGSTDKPFKIAKIYFETNASACDMGIQIVFDTDGVASAQVEDPSDRVIHQVRARNGLLGDGGQTEGFLESVEPVISELVEANGDCEPDPTEPTVTLAQFRTLFPAGTYDFDGVALDGTEFDSEYDLTYCIPAGPKLGYPDGRVNRRSDRQLVVHWQPVTRTIAGLPNECTHGLDIVGYQVLVYDGNAGELPQEFNVTVPGNETSVTVPPQFLQPNTEYKIEVLAIEAGGNQTITEGSFSTGAL